MVAFGQSSLIFLSVLAIYRLKSPLMSFLLKIIPHFTLGILNYFITLCYEKSN